MPLGGSSNTTTVQRSDPWTGVQPELRSLYGRAGELSQDVAPFYPGQTFAGFDPLQTTGMTGAVDYATGQLPGMVSGYQSTLGRMLDAPLNITQDPAYLNAIAANRSSVMDALTEDMLPSVRSGATAAGQFGGSRQGIAEGQAIGDAAEALARANAQTGLGMYDTASRTAAMAAGQMPGALQLGFTPSQTMMDIGGMQQGMTQQGIDEAIARHYYPQTAGRENLAWLNSILTGASPYAGQTTTAPGQSRAAGALGGALMGSQLVPGIASALAPAGMTVASAASPWLSGLGALGGALAFSDRRLKRNIVKVGKHGPHNLYAFNYAWGGPQHLGVMAQEVQETHPEAVTEVAGYLAVDYGRL